MVVVCCSVFYSPTPMLMKLMNVFLLVPSITIIWENYKNQTRFVVSIYLIDKGEKVSILNHKNETEVFNIVDLKLASDDERVYQKERLNHQTYLIFTVKTNKNIYHIYRGGVYLDENLLDRIIEGKSINKL